MHMHQQVDALLLLHLASTPCWVWMPQASAALT